MQRKAMLTGLTVVLVLTALAAFSQCRAGLFDGLFRKNKTQLKTRQLERRPPCEGCTYGFHQSTWRPWGTCCETAQSAYSSSPWSDDNVILPPPGPFGSSPTYPAPNGYDTLPNRAPVDSDYQFMTPSDSDRLLIPKESPVGQPAPAGLPPFQPFEGTPLDATSEEPVPALATPPAGSSPSPDGNAPNDLTSPDSLLLPESVRPAIPLPAPSTVPPVPGVGPQSGLQRSWQPISYSNSRDRRQSQTRLQQTSTPQQSRTPQQTRTPQHTRTQSSEWRVMPGFYGPQQTTRPADRTKFSAPPRR